MPSILVFVLFFAGVYFLLLRPQQQRVRRQRELITAIGVGDRVVTAGGLIGRVVDVNDERLLLEVADGVVVELLRLAISRRLDDSEAISDSVFGATTNDTLEEAYAADDYVADDETADPEGDVDPDADADADAGADAGAYGESTEVSEAGSGEVGSGSEAGSGSASEASQVGEASEAGSAGAPETVPPASAGGAAVPGVPVSPSTGVVGTDGTFQEAPPPAPRQDPH